MTGWHRYIPSMPYFPQGVIIPTDTRPLPFSMRMGRKAVWFCEPTVTAGYGLPEEFPTRCFRCTEREIWYGSRRTEPRACGPANKRTGRGFGNNGVTLIDRFLRMVLIYVIGPLALILGESNRMRECTFHVLAGRN